MSVQFITDNEGQRTAVIIPVNEYEDLLHQHHLELELSDEYKKMIDSMLQDETDGSARYVSSSEIKDRFGNK